MRKRPRSLVRARRSGATAHQTGHRARGRLPQAAQRKADDNVPCAAVSAAAGVPRTPAAAISAVPARAAGTIATDAHATPLQPLAGRLLSITITSPARA